MLEALNTLTQRELVALATEASARGDSGHALAYLKVAAARVDRTPQALFLLGSECAQLGLIEEAQAWMQQAVAEAPQFWIAHFQLGLLHLTSGNPGQAQVVWAPLAELPDDDSKAYLKRFHQGMLRLIADDFGPAVQALQDGIALNQENLALNTDMRRVIDAVNSLPGAMEERAAVATAETQAADGSATAPVEPDLEPSHLFISAYATRGRPH